MKSLLTRRVGVGESPVSTRPDHRSLTNDMPPQRSKFSTSGSLLFASLLQENSLATVLVEGPHNCGLSKGTVTQLAAHSGVGRGCPHRVAVEGLWNRLAQGVSNAGESRAVLIIDVCSRSERVDNTVKQQLVSTSSPQTSHERLVCESHPRPAQRSLKRKRRIIVECEILRLRFRLQLTAGFNRRPVSTRPNAAAASALAAAMSGREATVP